ncbi:helix-turn-helix domain-containing protein [Colwellia sp. MEBiC06753]
MLDDAKFSKAKKMLLTTDLPLKEIARHCGFTDKSNFSQLFWRISGVAPNQLREIGAK